MGGDLVPFVHAPTLRTAAFVLAALAALGAAVMIVVLWWYRRRTGFAWRHGVGGAVVAADTGAAPAVTLRDAALGLRGRPDYLVEEEVGGRRLLVPVELKPTRRAGRVYESDAVQLGAYLLALRAAAGERAAPYGYVRYAARTFRVPLTPELEERVRDIVAAVRAGRGAPVVHRSHDDARRCARCPVRAHCDEAL